MAETTEVSTEKSQPAKENPFKKILGALNPFKGLMPPPSDEFQDATQRSLAVPAVEKPQPAPSEKITVTPTPTPAGAK